MVYYFMYEHHQYKCEYIMYNVLYTFILYCFHSFTVFVILSLILRFIGIVPLNILYSLIREFYISNTNVCMSTNLCNYNYTPRGTAGTYTIAIIQSKKYKVVGCSFAKGCFPIFKESQMLLTAFIFIENPINATKHTEV